MPRSMAEVTWGTPGPYPPLSRMTLRSFALLSHPLLSSFSFLKTRNGNIAAGFPHPLGATGTAAADKLCVVFCQRHEGRVVLFNSEGRRETERVVLPERTDDVWHVYLSHVAPSASLPVIGWDASFHAEAGHRFNPHKLLIDPYSKGLGGHFSWNDAHFGYRSGHKQADLSFDRRDDSHFTHKSVVVDVAHTWSRERSPAIPWGEHDYLRGAHPRPYAAARGFTAASSRNVSRPVGARDNRALA